MEKGTQKVLVPLDDSTFSRSILPHVKALFAPSHYTITLFRAARMPEPRLPAGYTVTSQRLPRVLGSEFSPTRYESSVESKGQAGSAEHEWQELEEAVKRELVPDMNELEQAGYSVDIAVHFGANPAQEIVTFVEHEGVDVVAMATHGRTGLGRLLKGSVAEEVLHHLSVPILLLRAAEEAGEGAPKPSRTRGKELRDWGEIESNWPQYRASARATWSRLSEAELDVIAGKREKLVTSIHESYGISREDAEKEVRSWQLGLEPHPPGAESASR